jgi:hypothetical protein
LLHVDFLYGSLLTLKMGASFSPETLIDFQRGMWRYVPEDRTLHTNFCENLTSYNTNLVVSYNSVQNLDLLLSPLSSEIFI